MVAAHLVNARNVLRTHKTRWPTNLSIAFYLALRTKNTREYFQRFGGSGLKLRLAWLFCRHDGTDSRPLVQSGLWKLKVNDTGFFKLGGTKDLSDGDLQTMNTSINQSRWGRKR